MFVFKGLDTVTLDGMGLFVRLQRQAAFQVFLLKRADPLRLGSENSFDGRFNSIFILYLVKSGFPSSHQPQLGQVRSI